MENPVVTPAQGSAQFSNAFSLFKPSAHAVGLNIWTLIGLFIVVLIPIGFSATLVATNNSTAFLPAADITAFLTGGILTLVLAVLLGPALIYTSLKGAQEQRVTVGEVLKFALPFFWRFLGLGILLAFIYTIALMLLIVPFFFALRRYFFSPYYMVDHNLGVMAALKQSASDSKRYSGPIWGVIGIQFLINLPNSIPFIGWLISFMLSIAYFCAPAIRYLEIKKRDTPSTPGSTPATATNPAPPVVPTPPTDPQQP